MKYTKAENIFPEYLLKEIQKYVQGELIYIPKKFENYKKWGAETETKKIIKERNEKIIEGFRKGNSISELSKIYYLSEETIKKIVYSKKYSNK